MEKFAYVLEGFLFKHIWEAPLDNGVRLIIHTAMRCKLNIIVDKPAEFKLCRKFPTYFVFRMHGRKMGKYYSNRHCYGCKGHQWPNYVHKNKECLIKLCGWAEYEHFQWFMLVHINSYPPSIPCTLKAHVSLLRLHEVLFFYKMLLTHHHFIHRHYLSLFSLGGDPLLKWARHQQKVFRNHANFAKRCCSWLLF